MTDITIFHNPSCGTSRNTLALIRHAGFELRVIEYLKTPPSKQALRALVAAMGIPVRALLREKGTPYAELGLADSRWSDEQLLDVIVQTPILILSGLAQIEDKVIFGLMGPASDEVALRFVVAQRVAEVGVVFAGPR